MAKKEKVRFEIKTCLGHHIEFVDLKIPVGETNYCMYESAVLKKAGRQQFICEGCYDHGYHVEVVNA